MQSFPKDDVGKEIKALNLDKDPLPTHQSLGLLWDLNKDCFRFSIQLQEKPCTRRGFLSTLNSIYDPLGFVAPITIQGKILMREIIKGADWDEQLEPNSIHKWKAWTDTLESLRELSIPRMFVDQSSSTVYNTELHIFSDASEKAVCAVAYMKTVDKEEIKAGFVMGKAKIAPTHGHTIPRLELCGALLATQLGEVVAENLDLSLKGIKYYTDSKVVLGYINNKQRRFHNYVANRVQRILGTSNCDQWNYIPTKENPADCGTRGLCSVDNVQEKWLEAPKRLLKRSETGTSEKFPLVTPEKDEEIRVEVFKSTITEESLAGRFERFSDWNRLVSAVAVLKGAARKFKNRNTNDSDSVTRTDAETFILRLEQRCTFCEEVACLNNTKRVPKNSCIIDLMPNMDKSGIMRVGGRLKQSCLPIEEANPIILSAKGHIAQLISRHCHEKVKHQGRLITEGAIRNNGYWIIGAKRLVSSIIHSCIKCRKLRGTFETQQMADLPEDRVTPGPPFTSVGVDTFGPWNVVTRKTRGGAANSKRWAVIFTCLTIRAVHIEVVEEMSSSSFINALRRFIALRGNVKQFRSDRGTNFVGATDSLRIDAVNVEDGQLAKFLFNSGVTWLFNPPHSSHMGGVWERMIGITRRILDGMFQEYSNKNLTHEVIVTFMAEVCAIMNSRPLAQISTDPSDPIILSPAMLLNQKIVAEPVKCQVVSMNEIYKSHWKCVQALSDIFWKRWRERYLQNLQKRRKWYNEERNVKKGSLILIKDKNLPRNEWSVGIITNPIKSESDGKVRKVVVRVFQNDRYATYVRPITDIVILMEE